MTDESLAGGGASDDTERVVARQSQLYQGSANNLSMIAGYFLIFSVGVVLTLTCSIS